MRKSSLVAIQVCLLGALFASAAARAQDSPPRAWTLRSGGVVYRLALSDEQLKLEYFGPSGDGETAGRDSNSSPPRDDFSGLAEGSSLAPESLRLVAQETRSLPKGVNTVRLTLRHKELPLDVEALYAAWGETGVLSRELKLINRGATSLRVSSLPSLVWDLPSGEYTLRYLWGGWGQERQMTAERLGAGTRSFIQSKGRSTNHYVPWLSLRDEDRNLEYLAELAWSGNWSMDVEKLPGRGQSALRDQRVRATMGMRHDFGDALALAPGET
ncbi:MAG TPA: glycoside hydrolase family 36 N-terminal domain-containing protein, partial [Pyrinomonadaceae bacterium]|nr:glycoside hydrolase family 36 N-terminal domain-containing protein [Pyrinomonadaceae bacterium]